MFKKNVEVLQEGSRNDAVMVEISHLHKKYGNKVVLKDISFRAECGERIAIVGKNGCGKSTLMRVLAGIMRPDAGDIQYFGENPLRKKKMFRKFCGYVPQENPLMEELSVKDNLRLWGKAGGEAVGRLIELLQLQNIMSMPVEKLSGGMKRRVSIACALMNMPPVILMDEPTMALDLYYKESIHKWMKSYQKMNGIIIMTTHDEQEIMECDRCLVMTNGEMIELSQNEKRMDVVKTYILEH